MARVYIDVPKSTADQKNNLAAAFLKAMDESFPEGENGVIVTEYRVKFADGVANENHGTIAALLEGECTSAAKIEEVSIPMTVATHEIYGDNYVFNLIYHELTADQIVEL